MGDMQRAKAARAMRKEEQKARRAQEKRSRRGEDEPHGGGGKKHKDRAPGFGGWLAAVISLGVAVLAVFVEVEGAVAVPAAQRGDDLLQRAAGAFVVAAHHVGDDGVFGLMVDGLEKRLEAI